MNVILCVFALLLFAIFSQGGVEKCYICDGDCMDVQKLEEKMCESDDNTTEYLCQASSETTTNAGVRMVKSTRECVPNTEKNIEDCNALNKKKNSSCYNCDRDLCNKYIKAERDFKNEKINQGKVKKCYKCLGDCKNPQEETCDSKNETDFLCMAAVGTQHTTKAVLTVHIRNCIPNTKKDKEYCDVKLNQDKGYRCYTCDKNLCNDKPPIIEEKNEVTTIPSVPVEKGVKECYFCEAGLCLDSQVVSCEDVIKTSYVCMARVLEEGGVVIHTRGCILDTKKNKYNCEYMNSKPGSKCYTCSSNLCNTANSKDLLKPSDTDEGEGDVKECYNCTGWCPHTRKQKCDVKSYLCQESKFSNDDVIMQERKCVKNTKEAKEACERKNKQSDSSCYTCNTELCNNKYTESNGNTARTYSALAMVSLFLTKL